MYDEDIPESPLTKTYAGDLRATERMHMLIALTRLMEQDDIVDSIEVNDVEDLQKTRLLREAKAIYDSLKES